MALIAFLGGAVIITLKDELGYMVEKRRALNDVNGVNDEENEAIEGMDE
jgi:hypothetical protein